MEKRRAQVWVCMAIMLAMASLYMADARDPDPLQDFCVGVTDTSLAIYVNGMFCKNPNEVTSNDFLFRGFNDPINTSTRLEAGARQVNADVFPALNTQGLTLARLDFAPHGLNAPHTHPRSSELIFVQEGTLYVGFVTSNSRPRANKLFAKVLAPGDLFLFPQGLVHFTLNLGDTNASTVAVFGSQNPGATVIANALFGSTPPIMEDVLAKGFQLDESVIEYLHLISK